MVWDIDKPFEDKEFKPHGAGEQVDALLKCASDPMFGWMVSDAIKGKELDIYHLNSTIEITDRFKLDVPQWASFAVTMGYRDMLIHILASTRVTGGVK